MEKDVRSRVRMNSLAAEKNGKGCNIWLVEVTPWKMVTDKASNNMSGIFWKLIICNKPRPSTTESTVKKWYEYEGIAINCRLVIRTVLLVNSSSLKLWRCTKTARNNQQGPIPPMKHSTSSYFFPAVTCEIAQWWRIKYLPACNAYLVSTGRLDAATLITWSAF